MTTTTVTPTTEPEFAAATHILFGPLNRKVRTGDIDRRAGTIDFGSIAQRCFSSTEELLCDVAQELWSGSGFATVADVVRRLDDHQLRAVLDAIAILRPGVRR